MLEVGTEMLTMPSVVLLCELGLGNEVLLWLFDEESTVVQGSDDMLWHYFCTC